MSRIGVYEHFDPRVETFSSNGREGNPWSGLGIITAMNVGVYLLWSEDITDNKSMQEKNHHHDYMSANFAATRTSITEGRWYTLLTASFSHQALPHLLANMMALWLFGFKTYRSLAGPRFLCVYLAGGVFCSTAHVLHNIQCGRFGSPPLAAEIREIELLQSIDGELSDELLWRLETMDIPSIGASGSVMSVCGACALLFPSDRILVPSLRRYIPLPLCMGVYLISDMVGLVADVTTNTDHLGHLVGLGWGVLSTVLICRLGGRPVPLAASLTRMKAASRARAKDYFKRRT